MKTLTKKGTLNGVFDYISSNNDYFVITVARIERAIKKHLTQLLSYGAFT